MEAGYRAKSDSEDAVKMVETTVQLGAISGKAKEMQIEALKEAYEELKMYGEEEYHFRSDPVDETTPHLCDFCAVDQARSIGEKT